MRQGMTGRGNAPQGRDTAGLQEVSYHSSTGNVRRVKLSDALTPDGALEILKTMTPSELRLHLEDLLRWQQTRGKRLVNLAWYLLCWKYKRDPRPSPETLEERNKIMGLIRTVK